MREQLKNKAAKGNKKKGGAARQPHTPDLVERFPQRIGNKVVHDRPLTPVEVAAQHEERRLQAKARKWRQMKMKQRG